MSGAIPPLPHYAFMTWCLVKHRDFTFYLLLYYIHIYYCCYYLKWLINSQGYQLLPFALVWILLGLVGGR
jgi:hypothetical protein